MTSQPLAHVPTPSHHPAPTLRPLPFSPVAFWPRTAPASSTLAPLTGLPTSSLYATAAGAQDYKACVAACLSNPPTSLGEPTTCTGWTFRRFADPQASPPREAGCFLHGGPPDVKTRERDTGAMSGFVSSAGEQLAAVGGALAVAPAGQSWESCRGSQQWPQTGERQGSAVVALHPAAVLQLVERAS